MWRGISYAAGAFGFACAAVLSSPAFFAAAPADFETRWQAMIPAKTVATKNAVGKNAAGKTSGSKADRKADRLPLMHDASEHPYFIFSFSGEPVRSIPRLAPPVRVTPVRLIPRENDAPARKTLPFKTLPFETLPLGCEPSFSPITMPSMAHVSGRCLS